MPRTTGIPCPVCGSTNTYTSGNGRFLHCRAHSINQGPTTIDLAQGQQQDYGGGGVPAQQQNNGSVIGKFGLR